MTIKHWLYGDRKFIKEVKVETDCSVCIHKKVCDKRVEDRCVNYTFGTSQERGCYSCSNHYTRFDNRQPIPCFRCPDFLKEKR